MIFASQLNILVVIGSFTPQYDSRMAIFSGETTPRLAMYVFTGFIGDMSINIKLNNITKISKIINLTIFLPKNFKSFSFFNINTLLC